MDSEERELSRYLQSYPWDEEAKARYRAIRILTMTRNSTTDRLLRNAMREYARDPSDEHAQKVAKLLQRAQGTPEGEGEKCPICKDESPELWYRAQVKSLATTLIEEMQPVWDSEPFIPNRETLLDRIHEDVDNWASSLSTHEAQMALCVSEHDGAYIDNFGTDGVVRDGSLNWPALAFAAMEQDVFEYLDREGWGVNSPFRCENCSEAWETWGEAQDCCETDAPVVHLQTTAMTVACGICQCVGAPREHDIDDCPGRTATTDILQVTCPQCQAIQERKQDGEPPDSVADQATSEMED